MNRKYYKFAFSIIALLVLSSTALTTQEFQSDELLATSTGTIKTDIDVYEKIKMGGKTLTALGPSSFLSDVAIGSNQTWATAQTTATNWASSTDFSVKEKAYISSTKMASKSDLPIENDTLHTSIPTSDNWWLSDVLTGEGDPRSFVNNSNKVDAGYDRSVASNTSDKVCGTKTEHKEGGLNTAGYTGPVSGGLAYKSITFTPLNDAALEPKPKLQMKSTKYLNSFKQFSSLQGYYCPKLATGNVSVCSITRSEDYGGIASASMLWDDARDIEGDLGTWVIPATVNSDYPSPNNQSFKFPDPELAVYMVTRRTDAEYVYHLAKTKAYYGTSCPGKSVQAGSASNRPLLTSNLTSEFFASDGSINVSDTLTPYPDAGVGPYTLQVKDNGLKIGLDSEVKGVSGTSIDISDIANGKVSIPYDISDSAYDSITSTPYISVMKDGNYTKLKSVAKDGKGTVTLDINNLVTKTDGKIDLNQSITLDLYQEEITSENHMNYISEPTTITINIVEGKEDQTPLLITNSDKLPYNISSPSFDITTSGGSGSGAISYAIKEDTDSIASIIDETVSYTKAGTITVTATKASDDTYNESTATKTIEIEKIKQDLNITNTDFILDSATDFKVVISGRPTTLTHALSYDLTQGKDVVASIENDTITPIKVGNIEISVTSKGDDIYEDSTVKKVIQIISKKEQEPLVIENEATMDYNVANPSFDIRTSGGSGTGVICYAIKEDTDSIASIIDKTVSYTKAGTIIVTATKASDDTYNESTATKTIEIEKIKQDLKITNDNFVLGSTPDFKVMTSGRPTTLTQALSYDLTQGKDVVARIENDTITPIKVGNIEISVTSKGDDIYEDSTVKKVIQIINKAEQIALTITNKDKLTYDKNNLTFAITTIGGSTNGVLSYAIKKDDDSIVTLAGDMLTYSKPGTFTITATMAGDATYSEVTAEKTITIEKITQNFRITNTDFIINSNPNFTVETADHPTDLVQSLTYDLTLGKDDVASIVGNVITPMKAGKIKISATSAGDDYHEAFTAEKEINITNLPTQSSELKITNGNSVVYGANKNSLTITTTGGEGTGKVTFVLAPEDFDVASIDPDTGIVTIKKVGSFSVTATKSGGGKYADSVASKTITVNKAKQDAFEIMNTDFIIGSASNFNVITSGRMSELTTPLEYDVTLGKGTIVNIDDDVITPIKVGTITISVTSIGNENYDDITITKNITITDLPLQNQTLTITNTDVTWGDNDNSLQTKTKGGQGNGTIYYSLAAGDEAVASINSITGVVSIKRVGSFTITATKSGNGIYSDAQASKTITVAKKDITITPKKITKKVGQLWISVKNLGYDVTPAIYRGDTLQGTPIYAYGIGVNDQSPAGSYSYTISGLSHPNYNITFANGVLVVEADHLNKDDLHAYYRIKSGTLGLNNWFTSDVVFETLKKDGYDLISDTKVFTSTEFSVQKEGIFETDMYFKNNNGSITDVNKVPLKIDKTAPLMKDIVLHKKNTGAFAQFMNTLSFGNWFKQEIEVELSGSDNLSAVSFKYQEEINGVLGEWKDGTSKLTYGNGTNLILHVKAIDEAGNESIDTKKSERIQIDLEMPLIGGVDYDKSYYLPKLVSISDAISGLNLTNSYFVNDANKALHEHTLFNGIGSVSLHVEDNAGNVNELSFTILGLPPIDSIGDDDESRDIVDEVQKEYDDIKDDLTDEEQKKEIEDWLENAKEKSKNYVDKVKEPDTGIIVDGDGKVVFEEDIVLVVNVITEEIQNEHIDLEKTEGLSSEDELKKAYDIYLLKGTQKVQPSGLVKVKIPNTEELREIIDLKLVYIDKDNSVTLYPSTIDENFITFTTDHFSHYAIVGKKSKINIDVDKDGVLDLNIDTDNDGLPDLNLDIDDDGEADLNIDTGHDNIPDTNIDIDGDGKPDVNIDLNGDGIPDLNIAEKITSWKPNKDYNVDGFAYDTDTTIIARINVDTDNDGKADTNIDSDGDGIPDKNLDDYWKNKLHLNQGGVQIPLLKSVLTGDVSKWSLWWIILIISGITMIGSRFITKKLKASSKQ